MGTFDVPHLGHVLFLRKASGFASKTDLSAGSNFYIGVNTDKFVKQFKGHAPLYGEIERMDALRQLGYDNVVPNNSAGLDLIKTIKPDLVVIGSDWLSKGGYLQQIGCTETDMERLNFSIVFVPYSSIVSTTDILSRVGRGIA